MAAPENEHIYGIQLRESADDGSDFTNADADYRKLFLGEDGDLHLKDSSGTVTDIESAAAHIADTTDAHDASAISFDATGLDNTSATEVQTALEDFDAAITAATGGAAAFVGARAYAASAQTVSAATEFTVAIGTQDYDTDGLFDPGTPDRITLDRTGYWRIMAHVYLPSTAASSYAYLRLNGTTGITGSEADGNQATMSLFPQATIHATASDYVEVRAFRSTGTSTGATTGAASNALEAVFLGT